MRNRRRILLAAIVMSVASAWAPVAAFATVEPRSVEDFSFDSFSASYTLSRDADGTSELNVVETLVPVFPQTDQNRGIVRMIPDSYNDVELDTTVTSVTDVAGAPVAFEAEESSGSVTVSVGTDEFVHGRQTYVIAYTQHNVIREVADEGIQEFYWNVNGTGWEQSFGSVSAKLSVDSALASAATGQYACYQGRSGSAERCSVAGGEGEWTASTTSELSQGETLTMAVAFADGTFVVPMSQRWTWWAVAIPGALSVLALTGVAWLGFSRFRRWRDAPGRGVIVPQYEPPEGADLLTCGNVLGARASQRSPSAAIVSLAVRGVLHIEALSSRGAAFALRMANADAATGDELRLLQAVFGHAPASGEAVTLDGPSSRRGAAVSALVTAQTRRSVTMGLRARPGVGLSRGAIVLAASAGSAGAAGSLIVMALAGGATWVSATAVVTSLTALALMGVLMIRPRVLTEQGALLKEFLEGDRMYIEWAEAERLAYLQSVAGAERVGPEQRVRLYERMLPVAVLLGQEKSWGHTLGEAFAATGETPAWYVGGGRFDAVAFGAQIGALGASMSRSMTAPSSSGVSGSSGGGFAGGGGGGGGGGGR